MNTENTSLGVARKNGGASPLRQCPHGVDVGPLDDYERGPEDLVTSSYCEICNRAWEHRASGGRPWPAIAEREPRFAFRSKDTSGSAATKNK